jgi:hypothetical protein
VKLEDQVVSLELAKKLKELGVKQDGLYHYAFNGIIHNADKAERICRGINKESVFCFAPTTTELLEMLPEKLDAPEEVKQDRWILLHIEKYRRCFLVSYYCIEDDRNVDFFEKWNVKLADALAQMLIELIENGLHKPEK